MNRLLDWTKEEFDILVQNNALSDESLSNRLPRRTPDAIQVVRNGIHEFHLKGESSLLSKMMKERLTVLRPISICPICGERIDVRGG